MRELAYRVFLSAEKQESSPSTLKKSLQSYLAAINFLQVYRGVFLEDPSAMDLSEEERADELTQIDEKSKYAKWRIIEIKKQITNTSTSETISSTVINNNNNDDNNSRNISNLPMSYRSPPPVSPHQPTISPPQLASIHDTSVPKSETPASTIPQPQQQSSPPALLYDPKVLADCEKYARHAISALNFDDVESAAENLRTSLKLLQPYLKEYKK